MRRAPNFNRAISMICAVRPTFMKLTPGRAISPAQIKNESSSLEMLKVLIELCLYMLWMTDSVA